MVPAGEPLRRSIHRLAGVVMMALGVYHVLRLAGSARGREFMGMFRPRLHDITSGVRNLMFNAGLRNAAPGLGYPGYIEKIEYWALIWGTLIMSVTGLFLWFENTTLRLVPLWVMNLSTLIHYYEAVLASLAILVWHIYFVVLDPSIYPLKSLKRAKPRDI